MIFKELTLQNFKSHVDTTIEFNKGTTIILGDNGAGKSSIFEGISFALYKKYNTKSLNDLINTKSDKMTVSLSFLVGKQEYKVTRTRNQKKSTADLYIFSNNEYQHIVGGDKEVNNYIEDLLAIDADLFLNAIYIKQGEIDSLVTQKASDRKKNLSKLLQLDNLENSYKNIVNLISNYEIQRNQLYSLIDNTVGNNKQELIDTNQTLEKTLNIKNNELNELQTQIDDIKAKIAEQNTIRIKYHKLYSSQQRLLGELELLSNDIKDIEASQQNIQSYYDLIEQNKDINTKIDIYQQLIDALQERKTHVDNMYTNNVELDSTLYSILFLNDIGKIYNITDIVNLTDYSQDKISQLQNIIRQDINETDKQCVNITEQIREVVIQIGILKDNITNHTETLEMLNSVDSVCPLCQSVVDEDHKHQLIMNYQSMVQENQDKLAKRENELEILKKEEQELTQMQRDKNDFLKQIELALVVIDKIDSLKNIVNNEENYITQLDDKMNDYKHQLNIDIDVLNQEFYIHQEYDKLLGIHKDYQQAQIIIQNQQSSEDKYKKLKTQHQKKSDELDIINQDIAVLAFNEDLLQQNQDIQSQLHNRYYPLVKEIGQIENTINYNNTQLQNIDTKIQQNQENLVKVQKMDEFIKFLKDVRILYSKDGLQKDIRLSFKPRIEQYTRDFFSKFDFDYSGLILSDDYEIIITGPSGDSDVSMISGGEKIATALSLRLGIAQAVTANTIETILLDEPTTYLDTMRKQEFVNIIQNISLTPQMIIITHDPELENAADNVISVYKHNGQSIIA